MSTFRKKKLVIAIIITIFGILLIFILFASRIRLTPTKLCKTVGDLYYFNQSSNSTCFPCFTQGPCPADMILSPAPNNHSVGACVCDNTRDGRRVLLYHKATQKCYPAFTQGFCRDDEWVTLSTKDAGGGIATCAPNICLNQILIRGIISSSSGNNTDNHLSAREWVPLGDGSSCAILGARHESCLGVDEVIQFFKQKLYPACSSSYRKDKERVHFATPGFGVPPIPPCPEGFYKTELGCAVEFDAR